MPPRKGTVRELLEYIVLTRAEMVRAVGDDDFAVPAPPAPLGAIARVEAHLQVTLPPSYRAFLAQSNGVRDFADEIDLFSIEEMLSSDYSLLAQSIRQLGWRIGERILAEGLLIGGRRGYRNVFVIDYAAEPDADDERAVLYWSEVTLLRAASFRQFLEEWCGVADELLVTEREKAREAPPGIILPRPSTRS